MHWVLIVWLVIIAIVVFFNWANHRTKIQHAAFTKSDVIAVRIPRIVISPSTPS